MNYFADSFGYEASAENVENSNRQLFRTFNSQLRKNLKCSANKICWNNENVIIAVKCNCDKKTYHPVFEGIVDWDYKIPANIISGLKKIPIEKLRWIIED